MTINRSATTAMVFSPEVCEGLTTIWTFCCTPKWLPIDSVFDKTLHEVSESIIMLTLSPLLKHLAVMVVDVFTDWTLSKRSQFYLRLSTGSNDAKHKVSHLYDRDKWVNADDVEATLQRLSWRVRYLLPFTHTMDLFSSVNTQHGGDWTK